MRMQVDCRSPDGRPDIAPHSGRARIGRFESALACEAGEAEKTIDWAFTTDVGRQSGPSRREGNDRGGSNG